MSILYPAQRDFQPFLVYTASMCVFHNDFLEKPSIGSNQIISILGPTSVCDLGQKLHSILFGSHPWIYPSSNKHSEYFRPFFPCERMSKLLSTALLLQPSSGPARRSLAVKRGVIQVLAQANCEAITTKYSLSIDIQLFRRMALSLIICLQRLNDLL